MNSQEALAAANLYIAISEGQEIEVFSSGAWIPANNDDVDVNDGMNYRAKPPIPTLYVTVGHDNKLGTVYKRLSQAETACRKDESLKIKYFVEKT